MIPVLEFVFQSFWHWAGSVVLLGTVLYPFLVLASALGRLWK